MNTYVTRAAAIQREIIEPLDKAGISTENDHDLELIADDVLKSDPDGTYYGVADEDLFWSSVFDNIER